MLQALVNEDIRNVASSFMGKFVENGACGTLARKWEIHGIAHIGYHADAVEDEVYPMRHLIIPPSLLEMKRKEEHYDDKAVGIADGRGVEDKSGPEQMQHMAKGDVAIKIGVCQHEGQSAD